ncbi:hypothetical protein OAM01_00320 [bacterium]|nr:hypothetical protein [bacterium]
MDPLTMLIYLQQNKNPKSKIISDEARLLKENLSKMSPQEQNAFWADIEVNDTGKKQADN